MAAWLKKTGLKVQHETMGQDGTVCDCPAFDRAYSKSFEFESVWHQVRFPLDYIRSAHSRFGKHYWDTVREQTGITVPTGRSDKCVEGWQQVARHWLWVHQEIESRNPELTIRVESVEELWPRITELLGCPNVQFPYQIDRVGRIPKQLEKTPVITWDMLGPVEQEVRDVAAHYGYEVN
jgi:hypothetical protein